MYRCELQLLASSHNVSAVLKLLTSGGARLGSGEEEGSLAGVAGEGGSAFELGSGLFDAA